MSTEIVVNSPNCSRCGLQDCACHDRVINAFDPDLHPKGPDGKFIKFVTSADISKGKQVFLHGTSAANLEYIQKHGLQAFGGEHGKSIYGDDSKDAHWMAGAERRSGVYVTKRYDNAFEAGKNVAYGSSDARDHAGPPKNDVIILRIKVPSEAEIKADEMKAKAEKSFRVTGNIPSEWIEGYVRVAADKIREPNWTSDKGFKQQELLRLNQEAVVGVVYAPWRLNP